MKKFLTFLLYLFLVTQLHAEVDTLEGQATSGMSNWEGQDISTPDIDTVEGQTVASACVAPAWYNQTGITTTSGTGNVTFAWSGNVNGADSYAYDSSCNEITGTLTNGDIGTYQSSTALRVNAADEYIVFSQTANQYLKNDSSQTICVSTYLLDEPDNSTLAFVGTYVAASTDLIALRILKLSANIYFYYYTNSGNDHVAADDPVAIAAWKSLGGAWVVPTSNGISVSEGTNWEPDGADTISAMDNDIDKLYIGNVAGLANLPNEGTPGAGNDYYIRYVAIIDGYEAICSELTGW